MGRVGIGMYPSLGDLLPNADNDGLIGPNALRRRSSEEMEPERAMEAPLLTERPCESAPLLDEAEPDPREDEKARRDEAGADPVERPDMGLK
jgi:hypothetical protein